MRVFKNLVSYFSTPSEKNVTIIGYKTAGKSTIVDQLIQKKILLERREETHGSKTKKIKIQLGDVGHEFKITDVGGSKLYQDMFWKADVAKADGIIYVIDASLLYECKGLINNDHVWKNIAKECPSYLSDNKVIGCGCKENQMFRESREAKSFAFSILDTGKPILVFLNKMDLKDSQKVYTQEELEKLYHLDSVTKYNYKIFNGSALTGDNIFEAVAWLFSNME